MGINTVPKVQYQALVSVECCCSEIIMEHNHDGQLCCAVNNYMRILISSNQMWNKLGDKNNSFILRCRSEQWTPVWLCCMWFAGRYRCYMIIITPEVWEPASKIHFAWSQHPPEKACVGLLWKVGGMWSTLRENKLQIIWLTVWRLST